jgi:hypothetical protein
LTNTERGSSGAPCFTADWALVALHHAGGATGNEGIPFTALLAEPPVQGVLGT